jgi:aryl carrier-like protein
VAGVWGAGRQAAYAASNAFLDAWAQAARARGMPALSVAWGPWDGDGLATDEARAYLGKRGLRALPPARALDALGRALAAGVAHLVVADLDWAPFRESLEAWRARPLIADVAPHEAAPASDELAGNALVDQLASLRPTERGPRLQDWLAGECAAVLGHPDPAELDRQRGFFDLGLDSLMAVRLAARLKAGLGLRLSAALIFDQPNIDALACRLLDDLQLAADAPSVAADADAPAVFEGSDEDVLRLITTKYEEIA